MLKAYFLAASFFWLVFLFAFVRERSRYRNCYLLFIAIIVTVFGATFVAGSYQDKVILIMVYIVFFVLLAVPFFLIINGIIMFRREGHSLGNMLSFVFGLLIGIGEIATFWAVLVPETTGPDWEVESRFYKISVFSAFLSVSVIYVSMCFVVFMIYCVFLQIIPRKRDYDYVIIHGSGLINGEKVSKLLADRLDKAIKIYHKDPTPPMLIPSGGKGSDESSSEAAWHFTIGRVHL